MIKIVIVEDQTMLRDSLAQTIDAQPDMEVVASLADAASRLMKWRRRAPPARFWMCVPKTIRAVSLLRAASRNPIPRCALSS